MSNHLYGLGKFYNYGGPAQADLIKGYIVPFNRCDWVQIVPIFYVAIHFTKA